MIHIFIFFILINFFKQCILYFRNKLLLLLYLVGIVMLVVNFNICLKIILFMLFFFSRTWFLEIYTIFFLSFLFSLFKKIFFSNDFLIISIKTVLLNLILFSFICSLLLFSSFFISLKINCDFIIFFSLFWILSSIYLFHILLAFRYIIIIDIIRESDKRKWWWS